MSLRDQIHYWGTHEDEIRAAWPCDDRAAEGEVSLFRGIDVDAEPARVFRWLCQLKLAPYSYDLLDNGGRRSPRRLVEGVEHLAVGQRFMTMFRLVDFEPDRFMTLATRPNGRLGQVDVTYQTLPNSTGTRLLARLRIRYAKHPIGWLARRTLPFGDWIMMRKQFITLKALAETSPAEASG